MASATRMSLLEEANHDFQQNKYREAASKFVLLTSTQPDYKRNPLVQLNCGQCFFGMKEWSKAIEHFEEASTMFSSSGDEHADLAQQSYFLLGKSQFEVRKYEAAHKSFKEAQ